MTGVAELIVKEGVRAERPIEIDSSNTYRAVIGLSQGAVAMNCSAELLVSCHAREMHQSCPTKGGVYLGHKKRGRYDPNR